jgi:small subunit ribosomal protein S1
MVGQRHAFRITKFEGGRRLNLVVSRRALLEEEQAALAVATREQLREGAVLTGTVTGMKEFGAFVDLGGVEGMVHVSELALGRVRHPEEVLHVGQQVEVAVLRIEQTGNPKRPERIALSIRALAKDPWSDAAARYHPGTRVSGKVTRTQPFGAFVELEPGLEGMIHISELGAGRRINHPEEVLSAGQQLEATVLQVDGERRRIALSLSPDAAPAQASTEPPQSRTTRAESGDSGHGSLGDLLKAQLEKQGKP